MPMQSAVPHPACRACGEMIRHTFIDLGLSPLANSYVPAAKAKEGEMMFPLHAYVCGHCFLVQLEEFTTPEAIFSNYAYFSGYSTSWLQHAKTYVEAMIERFGLNQTSQVVEVASNDGYLLQYFVERGIPVRGIEPAANVAAVAIARGVPTTVAFFGRATALRMLAEGRVADLTITNNVLAHVPDIIDFTAGFKLILKPDGVGTFEFPHLLEMIDHVQFDVIYHEHYSYLSLQIVSDILMRHDLRVFDVETWPTHGGSIRVFFCHREASHPSTPAVARLLARERAAGLNDLSLYARFAEDVVAIKCETLKLLIDLREQGKTVFGYGAAAKGNTFLNYCGIGPELIAAVADRSSHKQGTLLPGSRIPVISPDALLAQKPDYLFILPWNLKEEITGEMGGIREWGGRFITAIPRLALF